MPSRPHAPVVKGYPSGNKTIDTVGEVLYNSNEVEPHVAFEMLERTVRLALADRMAESEKARRKEAGYEKEKKDAEKEKSKPERPSQPLWNGPRRREPIAWGGGASFNPNTQRIGH